MAAGPPRERLFVSLAIPDPVKASIAAVRDELRAILPKGSLRFTKPDQFHLTLRFLGEVETDRIPDVERSIADACAGVSPPALRAERIGVFPDLRYPRVVWAWVHDDDGRLLALQRRIDPEGPKDFTGHVTIARIHDIKRAQAEALAKLAHAMVDRPFGEWTSPEIQLMRSELSAAGARHTVVRAFPLAG